MTSAAGMTEDVGYGGREDFTERMSRIQYAFVDDPRKAALDADGLVSELLQSFADEMAQRRKELAAEPGDANAPATEQLRKAVRRYRDFVDAMTRAATGIDGSDEVLDLPELPAPPELPELPAPPELPELPAQTSSYGTDMSANDQTAADLAWHDSDTGEDAQQLEPLERERDPQPERL